MEDAARAVLPLSFAAAVSGLVVTSMFVLAPFIVIATRVTDDVRAVGFYSGAVVSAFYAGRMLTTPAWGRLADRRGRRRTLQASLLGMSAATFCCGLAGDVRWILALRFAAGCLSAVQSTCHAMAWELSGKRGTALIESGWTLASMLGPALAGLCWWIPPPAVLGSRHRHFTACALLSALQVAPIPFLPAETLRPTAQPGQYGAVAPARDAAGSAEARAPATVMLSIILNGVGVFVSSAADELSILFGIGTLGLGQDAISMVFLLAGALDFSMVLRTPAPMRR
ncbi:unnamed protein product [Prorocentrum cordatum]|uniref:Major facilitator superfamily (MFS) profile domain-containing protein n=1 Tax=Prorocentrum cordatum TaxID=2364126 RepID=A0ABN9UPV4_9DINO|nr:unnamed protein product [Polarella glacialis]